MNTIIVSLVTGYLLVALLLLGILVSFRPRWPLKAFLIVLTSAFYVFTYLGIWEMRGWPTNQTLPEHFRFLASQVEEPNKVTGDSGRIYIWASDLKQPNLPPRAYQIIYSNELHEQLIKATKRLHRGMFQIGSATEKERNKNRTTANQMQSKRQSNVAQQIIIHDMPDPLAIPMEK